MKNFQYSLILSGWVTAFLRKQLYFLKKYCYRLLIYTLLLITFEIIPSIINKHVSVFPILKTEPLILIQKQIMALDPD